MAGVPLETCVNILYFLFNYRLSIEFYPNILVL